MRFFLSAALCAVLAVSGCHAQQKAPATGPAASGSALSPELQKRILIEVRQAFQVPADVNILLGNETPSEFAGYTRVPVTFARGARVTTVEFLLSKDQKTLARLDKFDLSAVLLPSELAQKIDVQHRPLRGNPNAKVTIVSFDDFECPFCQKMHQVLFPGILNAYGDKIRIIYKDFPLVSIHPWAMHAAVDANCLFDQSNDAYWDFADRVHASHGDINEGHDIKKSEAELDKIAGEIGGARKLDRGKLDACIAKNDKSEIEKSMKEGEQLAVQSTPTLFINGERIEGAMPEENVRQTIDEALKQAGETPSK